MAPALVWMESEPLVGNDGEGGDLADLDKGAGSDSVWRYGIGRVGGRR